MAGDFARLALECVERDFPHADAPIKRDLVLRTLSAAAIGPWPEVEEAISAHLARSRAIS